MMAQKLLRVIAFKKIKDRTLMEIYLHSPVSKQPFFSAWIDKEAIIHALSHFHASFDDRGERIYFEDSEDEMLRKIVIFAGVVEKAKWISESKYELKHLLELIKHMTPIETLFWFSRFAYAYEDSRRAVHRVAKAFLTLYF